MTLNFTVTSPGVTALDTVPVLRPDAGEGAPGELKSVNDYVALSTANAASTSTKLQMLRLPSTVKLKHLFLTGSVDFDSSTGAALALDVGAYYGDGPSATNVAGTPVQDGTQASLAGTVISATAFRSTFTAHDVILSNSEVGFADPAKTKQPLWQALGLSSDPGGFIDVVVAVHTAAAGTQAAGNLGCEAQYVY